MARMLVIYRTPEDPKAFDEHYFNVHVPMAKKLPGLTRYETSVGPVVGMAGAKDTYFIATLHFVSLPARNTMGDLRLHSCRFCGREPCAHRIPVLVQQHVVAHTTTGAAPQFGLPRGVTPV